MAQEARGKGKTVYIGGLGPEINTDALYATFSPFGEIVDVQIPGDPTKKQDRATGVKPHRGFGFVEYAEPADAADAVDNMHMNRLAGRTLKVNLARPLRGQSKLGTHRAVWVDEEWLNQRENADAMDVDEGKGQA